ncbi:hypothetical protein [Halopseudomonas pelagia]|uniref:hypothetical protein n=1 Tax=Halopseudomonas pelagia TaxID=553151 RepID=UPI00039C1163|nr:hypothetical protein [Halopseudomonas pelagia]|tara:strand:+ start:143 stop:871 length:729 start_codon:yes stop_codon:yes gene_type:complete
MNNKSWWLAGVLCLSLPVNGASLFKPVEVSDAELAELRGRYVLPGRIIHFGVTMETFWQNSAGQGIGALVSLRVDGTAQPSLYVSYIDQTGSDTSVVSGTGQIIGGNGLAQIQGVSQSVRSAGDFNDAWNDVSISISSGGTDYPAQSGQPWNGATQFANETGNVQISAHGGGLQVVLQAAGQGQAQQQIGAGSVLQQANMSGSLNSVRNLAALNVALRDSPLHATLGNCTWEQLRALRPIGY